MFQGLRTVIFKINQQDLQEAKNWYAKVLGKPPYFDEPFYVGFNVGGFELGLHPSDEAPNIGDSVEVYLGVDDIDEVYAHCLKQKAEPHTEIQNVGGEIWVATLRDPYGNIFGLIENPEFKIEG